MQQTCETSHQRLPWTQKGSGESRGHVLIFPLSKVTTFCLGITWCPLILAMFGWQTGNNCFIFPWLQVDIIIPPLIHPTSNHVFSRLSSSLFGYSFYKSRFNCALLCFSLILFSPLQRAVLSAPSLRGVCYSLHNHTMDLYHGILFCSLCFS